MRQLLLSPERWLTKDSIAEARRSLGKNHHHKDVGWALSYLLLGLALLCLLGTLLLLGLALLEQSLGHEDLILSWDAPVGT